MGLPLPSMSIESLDIANMSAWTSKDLVGIEPLTAAEITHLLDTARRYKQVGTREIKSAARYA
jgi:aspartate carbamoyltransferase catalytic subunit